MAVSNSLTKGTDKEVKMTFSQTINTPIFKELIRNALHDEGKVTRFVTSIVSAVSASPSIQKCDAGSIISTALQGEALGLSPSPSLGEFAIVPYGVGWNAEKKDYDRYKAQFQIMTNGIIQLAMRTGLYKDLGSGEIREGEYKGKDKRTGKPVIEFIEDDDERESKPIIGYFAYFELSNGFFRSEYITKQSVINHAQRYSNAFDYAVYQKVVKGEKLKDWKEENKAEAPWIKHFDTMACNLALRKVLKNAPKSIEMRTAESYNEEEESNIADAFISSEEAKENFFAPAEEKPAIEDKTAIESVKTETQEVVKDEMGKGKKKEKKATATVMEETDKTVKAEKETLEQTTFFQD